MKKAFIIFILLFGIGFSDAVMAQSGGRKSEKKVKTKKRGNHILTQYKSRGHADEFANGNSGRRSRLYRLFHKPKPSWRNRSSGSRRSHNRDNRDLFSRERQKGHISNAASQDRQSASRSRNRDRGNISFFRRKHHRSK